MGVVVVASVVIGIDIAVAVAAAEVGCRSGAMEDGGSGGDTAAALEKGVGGVCTARDGDTPPSFTVDAVLLRQGTEAVVVDGREVGSSRVDAPRASEGETREAGLATAPAFVNAEALA